MNTIPLASAMKEEKIAHVTNNNEICVDNLNKPNEMKIMTTVKTLPVTIIEIDDTLSDSIPTTSKNNLTNPRNNSIITLSSDDEDSIRIVPTTTTGRKRKLNTATCGHLKKRKLSNTAHVVLVNEEVSATSTPLKNVNDSLKKDIGISPIVTARHTLLAVRHSRRILNKSQQTGANPLPTIAEEKEPVVMNNMQTSTTGLEPEVKEDEKENDDIANTNDVYNSSNQFISSNVFHQGGFKFTGLRPVVIDGSNIAMSHGQGTRFSVRGLKICIDFFIRRGHRVYAFIPAFRMKRNQSDNQKLLMELVEAKVVYLTSSREVMGMKICSYDDRILVQAAAEMRAVIVSCDNYRDLVQENPRLSNVIANDILAPTWVDDMIIFPQDPRGRFGPTLEQLLRFSPPPVQSRAPSSQPPSSQPPSSRPPTSRPPPSRPPPSRPHYTRPSREQHGRRYLPPPRMGYPPWRRF